jgi:hypothetical protein
VHVHLVELSSSSRRAATEQQAQRPRTPPPRGSDLRRGTRPLVLVPLLPCLSHGRGQQMSQEQNPAAGLEHGFKSISRYVRRQGGRGPCQRVGTQLTPCVLRCLQLPQVGQRRARQAEAQHITQRWRATRRGRVGANSPGVRAPVHHTSIRALTTWRTWRAGEGACTLSVGIGQGIHVLGCRLVPR